MAKVDNIYKTMENIGKQIVAEMGAIIQQGYKGRPAVASGNLLRSLSYDVFVQDGVWNLVIEYADYGKYVNKGRNPGKFPPRKDIEDWVRLKGLPDSAVYPIMVKIARGGFYSQKMGTLRLGNQTRSVYTPVKGLNFTSPLEKNLDLGKLMKEFGEAVRAQTIDEINEMLKKEINTK